MSNQIFKAVYFPDYKEANSKGKGFILAFGVKNKDLYKNIAKLRSNELRGLLGTDSYIELEQRANEEGLSVNTYCLWYLRKNLGNEEIKIKTRNGKTKTIAHFKNRVIEDDCLEVMQDIPSKSIDMILCDLPYGTTQNHWDSVIPLDQLGKQYRRII